MGYLVKPIVAVLFVMVMSACTGGSSSPAAPNSSGSADGAASSTSIGGSSVTGECRALHSQVAPHPDAVSLERIATVLSDFSAVAWNPTAPAIRPSTFAGGLFVNFRPTWNGKDSASVNTNITTTGQSDAESGLEARHDPLTDLAILRDIDAYLATGAGSAGAGNKGANALRCKLQPVVEAEFIDYGVARGWVYQQLVDLSLLDIDGPWAADARRLAARLAQVFSDVSKLGTTTRSAQFRPDWVAESAAALTDAGKRFSRPQWTRLGTALARTLVLLTPDAHTGLFPGQGLLNASGAVEIADPLVKVGSQAQILDALLSVYDVSHDSAVIAAVRKAMLTLQSPAVGIADATHGGWFYALNVDGTHVRTAYKETRQAWMVPLLRHTVQDLGAQPASVVAALAEVRDLLYQKPSKGYVYRVASDWAPYVSTQKGERVEENWATSEATGIALNALLGPLT
jgi:hypothetical protein